MFKESEVNPSCCPCGGN